MARSSRVERPASARRSQSVVERPPERDSGRTLGTRDGSGDGDEGSDGGEDGEEGRGEHGEERVEVGWEERVRMKEARSTAAA